MTARNLSGLLFQSHGRALIKNPISSLARLGDLFEADFARSYELTQPAEVGWTDVLADLVLEGF